MANESSHHPSCTCKTTRMEHFSDSAPSKDVPQKQPTFRGKALFFDTSSVPIPQIHLQIQLWLCKLSLSYSLVTFIYQNVITFFTHRFGSLHVNANGFRPSKLNRNDSMISKEYISINMQILLNTSVSDFISSLLVYDQTQYQGTHKCHRTSHSRVLVLWVQTYSTYMCPIFPLVHCYKILQNPVDILHPRN